MSKFVRRRVMYATAIVVLGALGYCAYTVYDVSLGDHQTLTGWVLFALIMLLTLFNMRKKFPVPPLGSSRTWLQVHIYAGFLVVLPFVLHAGVRWPQGILEGTLAAFFLAVVVSGVAGIAMSRLLPRRLTGLGGEAIFEMIPVHRRVLMERADLLAEESVAGTGYTTIAYFYNDRLREFLLRPRNVLLHLAGVELPLQRLLNVIHNQTRYLNDKEKAVLREITACVEEKNKLDHQYALQFALKVWLFVHIPLTYGLILLSLAHVMIVYAFHGRGL